jgi:GTPase SAR1 family protein
VHRQWSSSDVDDSAFENACNQALEQFSRPFPFTQLCLVGEGRAGKTALASSLCGRSFKQTESTIGVGVEHLQVTHSDSKSPSSEWSPVHASRCAVSFAEEQLAWAVIDKLDGKPGDARESIVDVMQASVFDVKRHESSSHEHLQAPPNEFHKPLPSTFETHPSQRSSELFNELDSPPYACLNGTSPTLQRTKSIAAEHSSDPVVLIDKQLVLQRSTEAEPFRIKLMDFGGQKAFYSLHHLYLSRHGVYLLVFNMEWLVGPRASVQKAHGLDGSSTCDSSLSFLSFWLNSIYLHAKSPDGSVAPIFLIGTHKDVIRSPADHESISVLIYEKFKTSPAFGSVVPFKRGTSSSGVGLLWFYPMDNTKGSGDPTIEVIKLAIHEKLLHEDYLKRSVPLPWLQVFDAIQCTKQLHMPLSQVEVIAKGFGFPITKLSLEDEVTCMLKFFTESGLLMHHNCPTLRNIVVLDVIGCLVRPASIIMCQHDIHMLECHETARSMHNEEYLQLTTEGVLCDVLLDQLWCDCINIKREIVELMIFYGLMVPVLEETSVQFSQYLVPSLLPKLSNCDAHDGVMAHCYYLLGMKHVTEKWEKIGNVSSSQVASHGFSPAGLFARLTGKIVSRSQAVYNFFGAQYGSSEVRACFGSHVFVIRELPDLNTIQLLVMVDNPRKLVSEISHILQSVINEMIPSLGFCPAVLSDGSCGSNFQVSSVASAHFVSLKHITQSIGSNCIVHTNSASRSRLCAADARTFFEKWVAPEGLRARYDVFLSYRWTGSFDEDLTSGLFNNLSEDLVGSSGREIHVFLDKRRLQDGRNFQDDFADALLVTTLPVVILSTAALQRMAALKADSLIDNLLLEWTLIVELLQSKTIRSCLPIIIGSYSPSAPRCSEVFSNFFQDVIKAPDGTVQYSGIDSLPDISVASIIDKVRGLLREHNLPESPNLSSLTVRSVVKRLSMHKAVFVSDILRSPMYQNVPESHVREEATRIVIERCVASIRTILDSIQVSQASTALSTFPANKPANPSFFARNSVAFYAAAAVGAAVAASLLLWRARRQMSQ